MDLLSKLEAERVVKAAANRAQMNPGLLAFADLCRATWGTGVRMHKGLPWPGGCDPLAGKRLKRSYR